MAPLIRFATQRQAILTLNGRIGLSAAKGLSFMPDSETEEQTLERIEAALRKIAAIAQAPKPAAGGAIDRAALARSLDMMINRLRSGLESHKPAPEPEPAETITE
jgi:hypothetical protein